MKQILFFLLKAVSLVFAFFAVITFNFVTGLIAWGFWKLADLIVFTPYPDEPETHEYTVTVTDPQTGEIKEQGVTFK